MKTIKTKPSSSPKPGHETTLKLELFDQDGGNAILQETDFAPWIPHFEKIAAGGGTCIRTNLGTFDLTWQHHTTGSFLTLVHQKDESKLVAELVCDQDRLRGLRISCGLKRLQHSPGAIPGRISSKTPCLLIGWQETTGIIASADVENIQRIIASAAFGLLKFYGKLKINPKHHLTVLRTTATPEPLLNFATP